jgi:hypothetical protein
VYRKDRDNVRAGDVCKCIKSIFVNLKKETETEIKNAKLLKEGTSVQRLIP